MFDSMYNFFHSEALNDCTNQEKKEKCISFLKENIIQEYDLSCPYACSFEDVLLILERRFSPSKKILCSVMDRILFIMKCMQGVSVNLEYGTSRNIILTGEMVRTIVICHEDSDYENILFVYNFFNNSFFSEKKWMKCLR